MDDQPPSFKGRVSKNYSPEDEEKFWEWIQSVDKTLGLLRSRPRDANTYRVPSKLRAMKHEAYTPQMVSIGPFHRQKPELRAMEELKWTYMLAFVDRVVMSDMENPQENTQVDEPGSSKSPQILALYKCSKVIAEVEEEARAWYAEEINLNKHRLVEMLLVDGCFILELFYRCNMINTQKFEDEFLHGPPESRLPFESLAGNFTMVQTLTHDLILLENQIPYFVLQKLYDVVSSSKTASDETYRDMPLEDYVFWFVDSIPMLRLKYTKHFIEEDFGLAPPTTYVGQLPTEDRTYNHLLGMLHHVCKIPFERKVQMKSDPNNWGFTRCATELFKSGFQIATELFKSRFQEYRSIVDIRFIDGILFIPQVVIDRSSDTIFRNFIALEQTSVGRHSITSYVKLMSTLIRSPEDANLLEQLGIIIKADDVEDISTFFKSLCSQVAFVDFCYTDLCYEVEYYQIPFWRWHRVKGYLSIKFVEWKASVKDLKQDYFKTKWSFLAFLAASFVILLAIVQTFYTVRAYYPPYH